MDGATLMGQSLYRKAVHQSQAGGQVQAVAGASSSESNGPKVLLAGAYLHHGFHEDGEK